MQTTTVIAAAKLLGLSPGTVRTLIERGELIGHKKTNARNSPYVLDAASVISYRDRQQRPATDRTPTH